MMKWTKALPIVAALILGLYFIPAIPTSVFFSVSAFIYDVGDVHDAVELTQADVKEIVELISRHDLFGKDSRYPSRLSLKQYLFDFESVGFQGIGLVPLGFTKECSACTVAAFSSVVRNSFDGASTMYFLAQRDGVWQIRQVRDGITGTRLDRG